MIVETDENNKEKNIEDTKQPNAISDLLYLAACAVNNKVPNNSRVDNMDLDLVYNLASFHSIVSLVAFSLEQVIELPHKYDQDKKKAIRKLALFDIERIKLFAKFNQEKIWYMPLKGIILKDYYPKSGMREMADNDILCDSTRMDDVKLIMEGLGYTCEQFGWTHDVYSQAFLSFEFHRTLFHEMEYEQFYKYYKTIKDRLIRCGDSFEYRFKPEDFYVYIIAHEYKHYISGGTGLRSLLDTYVFLKRYEEKLDWDYLHQELKALSLCEFEKMNRTLSEKIFSGETLNDEEKRLFMYYLSSGVHGSEEHIWRNNLCQELSGDDSKNAKRKYLRYRLFHQGESLKERYPFVYRHKILIPGLYVYRFVKAVITKPKEIWTEFKHVKQFKT